MNKSLSILFILLFSLNFISATDHVNAQYHIIEDRVLVEISLEQAQNFEIKLPYDYKTLEVNVDYIVKDNILDIVNGQNIEISYITKSFLDKAGSNYFVLKNELVDNSNVKVFLPEGAVLGDIVFPNDYEISTDGRKIIIEWKEVKETEILVSYDFVKNSDLAYLIIIIMLIIGIIIGGYLYNRKIQKRIKEIKQKSKGKKSKVKKEQEITKNLYEEEKKIVKYLLGKKGNEAWTKEIVRDVGISKVKLSRKLRSLEAKEVIKRIPYGNENRIRILK